MFISHVSADLYVAVYKACSYLSPVVSALRVTVLLLVLFNLALYLFKQYVLLQKKGAVKHVRYIAPVITFRTMNGDSYLSCTYIFSKGTRTRVTSW